MKVRRVKSLMVAVFSLFSVLAFAQNDHGTPVGEKTPDGHVASEEPAKEGNKFDANEVIFGHVLDAHSFHFFDLNGHPYGLSLPVILYDKENGGIKTFSSARFEHGHSVAEGRYQLVTEHWRHEMVSEGHLTEEQAKGYRNENIIAVDPSTKAPLAGAKVYDFSITRNVVQMMLALILLVWIMLGVAKRYKSGQGVTSAPRGMQNAIEPVITFVRDEVAKPNLGHHYRKFMPLLLTIFFFILINNLFGLIPGSANVTGNIAFTAMLGLVSFLVINISGNKHYWGHIFNPPVPFGIKFIMVPVEILSIITKPFALIIRLFANMLAGHIIIICLISLIFIFGSLAKVAGWGFMPISIAFSVFIFVIEVLVAFIQAFIFTNLTAVFIGQATEDHHQHEGEAHAGHPPTEPVIIG
ncbi:ATP synthase F0 subunit A [Flaviaesturariibacter flavus]|uniref:ATP synthase subunit a n=1 Tax=Flaviaesturariibacter flavus TaxID=2502780 RepID=A0A4R1BN84_9BACT|nr:F0F1 ATP synthase subunit A [Flaviaesturariibacter flavus]TCJ18806.1 ATP synthase F0 subunit A [Flaviaesturariibacter flavus]